MLGIAFSERELIGRFSVQAPANAPSTLFGPTATKEYRATLLAYAIMVAIASHASRTFPGMMIRAKRTNG
jgi:hypothetical protein